MNEMLQNLSAGGHFVQDETALSTQTRPEAPLLFLGGTTMSSERGHATTLCSKLTL